jgi:hypothetical protein
MKFLSDILAKAGLTVDGVVTLNNTATGQTPNANDNSTKLATTAWVRTFVQPYSLPIASDSILGGIKVGTGLSIDPTTGVLTASGGSGGSFNFRTIQEFTATSGQSTFTISGGYVVGYVEVLINGVYLSESLYTATNGTTIVLDEAAATDDIVTVFLYSIYNFGGNIYARNVDTLTATAGQTSFTTSYIPGQIDVYYNGSKLTAAEFTATSGTAIVLGQAAVSGDIIEVVTYLAGAGINASRTLTINGTTYDLTANRTWTLTTSNISEGTNLYYTDTRVGSYLTTNSYATQSYVSTQINNLINGAPGLLDTLDELAAALGDDANFASTITTSIGTKVPQARTITINGTSYDLSADRSWSIAAGVTSFNTRTGDITPASGDYTTAQVTESGNLYYTNTRARLAISLTTTGTSGAATYDNTTGVLNIPQYQGGVTSFNTRTGAITLSSLDVTTALTYTPVTNARTITINGTSYDLSANRSWTIAPDVSVRNTYAFTATAAQTTFTVTGGYSVGLVDVFINGVKLAAADFTATNGTTVVLGTGTGVGNIVEIVKYVSAFTTAQEALNGTGLVRMSGTTVTYDNATYATQSYVTTAVANLVNSAPSTLDTLNELATALGNDANFATTITTSIGTKQPQLSGTGFVKISGTTISYDNSTYLTTASATSTYLPLAGGTLTGALGGTIAVFSSDFTQNETSKVGISFASGYGQINSWGANTSTYGGLKFQISASNGSTVNALTLLPSGAATFISSISAGTNITAQSSYFAQDVVGDPVYMRVRNLNTGGYSSAIALSLYGYSGTAAYYDVLTIRASYPGYGRVDFFVKGQSTSTSISALSIDATNGAAIFSSTIQNVSGVYVRASGNSDLPFLNFSNADGAYNWGRIGGLLQGDGDGSLYFQTKLGGSLGTRFTITSTGAATFTNTVTAVTNLRVNSTGATGSAYSAVLINSPAVTWNLVNDDNGGGGDLRFYNDSLASDAIRIKRSNNNVGIGFTTVTNKLQVAGEITSHAGTNTSYYAYMNYLGTTYNFGNTESTDNVDFKIAGGGTFTSGGNFRFWTQTGNGTPVQRMIITPNGNVGIGISPQGLLDVYKSTSGGLGGHIYLRNNGAAVGNEMAVMFVDGDASTMRAAISSTTEGAPYFGDIKFKTGLGTYASLTTRMTITGSGRVGVNTTATPETSLHVTDPNSDTVMKLGGGGAARDCNFSMFSQSAGNTVTAIHYNGQMAFYSGKFNIASSGSATLTGTLTQNSSDTRLKENIIPISNALSKIEQLTGFTYTWNQLANSLTGFNTSIQEVGLSAQSVQSVLPEAVFPAPFDNEFDPATQSYKSKSGENYLTVQYEKLVPLLIQAVKELKAEIDILKAR